MGNTLGCVLQRRIRQICLLCWVFCWPYFGPFSHFVTTSVFLSCQTPASSSRVMAVELRWSQLQSSSFSWSARIVLSRSADVVVASSPLLWHVPSSMRLANLSTLQHLFITSSEADGEGLALLIGFSREQTAEQEIPMQTRTTKAVIGMSEY